MLFLVLISNMEKVITSTFLLSFANNTYIKKGSRDRCRINTRRLGSVCTWATPKNVAFNFTKFGVIDYGSSVQLITATSYKSAWSVSIKEKDRVKVPGVLIRNDG